MAADIAEQLGAGALEESRTPLKVRAFFGLPLQEPQREELGRFIADCASVATAFRWTPPQNLHLTIRFIGSVDAAVANGIAERLADQELEGFDVQLDGIGTFKRRRLVRVVWMGLESGLKEARALAARVEEECVMAGLGAESRPFRAHLTMARARSREDAELPPLPSTPQIAPWRASELVLYSSHLSRTGSVYEALRRVPLK